MIQPNNLTLIDVIKVHGKNGRDYYSRGIYKCGCGNIIECLIRAVELNIKKSCGCYKSNGYNNRTHGLQKHPLFIKWVGMKGRCYNSNNAKYHRYGGRGVTVCEEWLKDFKVFYDWAISNGWEHGMQIDKDIKAAKLGKDGMIYSPEWCSIVTNAENANYRKGSKFFTIDGETKNIMQWCNSFNLKQSTFYHRVYIQKMTFDEALKKPSRNPRVKPIIPPRHKLNWDMVGNIRDIKKTGLSNIKIADMFNVDASTISNIVNNKSWIK